MFLETQSNLDVFFVVFFFDPFKPWDGYRHKNIIFGREMCLVHLFSNQLTNTFVTHPIHGTLWLGGGWTNIDFFCDVFNPKIWGNDPFWANRCFLKNGFLSTTALITFPMCRENIHLKSALGKDVFVHGRVRNDGWGNPVVYPKFKTNSLTSKNA